MNKLAKNTIVLYLRQIIVLFINLISIRAVLNALGVEEYGIFTVVYSTVIAFGFLSGSLSVISQRYLSYAMGAGDAKSLNIIFNTCVQLSFIVSFVVIILTETFGVKLLENYLTISADHKESATTLLQLSIFTFLMSIFSSPFAALLIAHEDMTPFAIMSMIEAALKLAAAIILPFLPGEKITIYGVLLLLVGSANLLGFYKICKFRHPNFYITTCWDKRILLNIGKFASWTLIGNVASIFKIQGTNILINIYFGVAVNAASAVALQVNYSVLSLVQNITLVVRPAVIRSYSSGAFSKMMELTYSSTKATFFLLLLAFIPLQFELVYVITLWLNDVPKYAIPFISIVLITTLFDALSFPLMTLSQATGNIKIYQILVGGINLMNLPISLSFLHFGAGPLSVFWIATIISFCAFILRLALVSRQMKFSKRNYCQKVLNPAFKVLLLSCIVPAFITLAHDPSLGRVISNILFSIICTTTCIFWIGLNKVERQYIVAFIQNSLTGVTKKRLEGNNRGKE